MSTGNDDLDDGLEYAFEPSEDEGVEVDEDGEAGEAVEVEEGATSEEAPVSEEKPPQSQPQPKSNKRKRKREESKNKKKQKLEYDLEQKRKFPTETADIIAEKLAAVARKQNPDLSPLELADVYLNKSSIEFTGDWEERRSLTNLPNFLEHYIRESVLSKAPEQMKKKRRKSKSAPVRRFAVVLSVSALRACDVHRATRAMTAGATKLISKNKLKDDLKVLETTDTRILASTPGRFYRVLEAEDSPLKPEDIGAIVCDCFLDSKMQTIWELKETLQSIRRVVDGNESVRIYMY